MIYFQFVGIILQLIAMNQRYYCIWLLDDFENHTLFTWWRHQKETFSALLAFRGGIHRSPVDSPHKKAVMRSFDIFWSAPGQTVEQTIETPVIWDTIALIMTSL